MPHSLRSGFAQQRDARQETQLSSLSKWLRRLTRPLLAVLTIAVYPGAAAAVPQEIPYEELIEPFRSVFRLYAEDSLYLDPSPGNSWSESDLVAFQLAMFDSNQANTTDVFPQIWNYFCDSDADTSWDGILFKGVGGQDQTKILIELTDFMPTGQGGPGIIRVSAYTQNGSVLTPDQVVNGAIRHEFAHVCYFSNHDGGPGVNGVWANEMMAEAANYVHGVLADSSIYNSFYDSGFHNEISTIQSSSAQYNQYRTFHSYLFANFSGSPSLWTDDLLYNWIRLTPRNTGYYGLGVTLDSLRTKYPSWLGLQGLGEGADEMVGSLFHRWAVAKYVSRDDVYGGIYGFGEYNSPRDINAFAFVGDPDTTALMRVRCVPPPLPVGESSESGPISRVDFTDLEQDSTVCDRARDFGVRDWGSDYIVFKADPAYFATNGDTLLGVRLDELYDSFPEGCKLRVGYIAYATDTEPYYEATPSEVVEQVEVCRGEITTLANFCIPGFGLTKKVVVVVISLARDPVTTAGVLDCTDNSSNCMVTTSACSQPLLKYKVTYRFAPSRIFVPQEVDEIQAAIDSAAVGQIVTVAGDPDPYAGPIRMKRGVRVEASGGENPSISVADSAHACLVWFPDFEPPVAEVADTSMVLKGFQLQGGNETVIKMDGSGKVEDCTIIRSSVADARGIHIDLRNSAAGAAASAVVRNCDISSTYNPAAGGFLRGIEVSGGSVRVESCRIRLNGSADGEEHVGILLDENGGTSHSCWVTRCLITGEGGGGIKALAPGDIIEYCTLDSLHSGIEAYWPTGVHNCIVSNTTDQYPITGNGGLESCVVTGEFPSGANGCSVQLTDPLYCGSGDYTLRVDSPGNPGANACGESIGAFPVTCAWGELARDVDHTTVPLTVTGDLTIPYGRTLALTDCPLTITETDIVGLGQDSTTVEILAEGKLSIISTDDEIPLLLRSETGVRGSWDGIIVSQGANVSLYFVDIEDAKIAVGDDLTLAADSLKIEWCTFRNFQTAAVYLRPAGLPSSTEPSPLLIDQCKVYMASAPYGIYLKIWGGSSNPFYNTTIGNTYISNDPPVDGAPEGMYGIYIHGEGLGPEKKAKVIDCEISLIKNGSGIAIQDSSASLTRNRLGNCLRGIEIRGSGSPVVRSDRTLDNGIINCTYGIYVAEEASPIVDSVLVQGPPTSSGYGLYTADSTGGIYEDLIIDMRWTGGTPKTATAFEAHSTAVHKLRNSKLEKFYKGVNVGTVGMPDLGASSADKGNNSIYQSGAVFYVKGKNRLAELPNVKAQYNYWGEVPPPSSKFDSWVDYSNWLTTPPLSVDPADLGLSIVGLEPQIMAGPNPFVGSLSIQLRGLDSGTECKVSVFDIQGRCLRDWSRTLVEREETVTWDGKDELGREAPPGVYFVRATAGEHGLTAKLVRLAR